MVSASKFDFPFHVSSLSSAKVVRAFYSVLKFFSAGVTNKDLESYNSCLESSFGPRAIEYLNDRGLKVSDLKEKYFGKKPVSAETLKNYEQMHSDVEFVSGIHEVLAIQAVKSNCPTYYYKFSYDNGKSSQSKVHLGLDMPGDC